MDIPPEIREVIPGAAGSATALLFMREGSAVRGLATFMAGWASSWILGPTVAAVMGVPPGVGGWTTGLFGMAIVAGVFDAWMSFDKKKALGQVWNAVMRRLGGSTNED